MGHFGEIRLADPVFSAVVLPSYSVSGMKGVKTEVIANNLTLRKTQSKHTKHRLLRALWKT